MKLPRPKRPTLRRFRERSARKAEAEQADAETAEPPKPEPPKPDPPKPGPFEPETSEGNVAKRAPGLWFRLSTRVRAAGYWVREKLQKTGRSLRKAGFWLGDRLANTSRETRIRTGAVAGVLVLYLLIKFAPVPGVPCQISAVKECAPDEQSFPLVPADALLYAHLTLDRDSTQFERAGDVFEQLSDLRTIITAELPAALPTPSGAPLDITQNVLPWAERDLALTLLPGAGKTSLPVFTVGVEDKAGAEQFLAQIAPAGEPKQVKQGDAPLSVYAGGFAAAFVEDSVVFGREQGVRASLDAEAGVVPALEGSEQAEVRDELPEARFAEVYLSRSGVQRLLAGRPGTATQLETFVDYGATDGVAAAAVAREDGIEVDLISSLNPKLTEMNPSFFSGLPVFEPTLTEEAGGNSIGYIGVGEVGPTLTELLARAGGGGGVAASLQGLADRLEQEAGVDPLRDLLPALSGQAALVAEPTAGVPFVSLVVDDIDEEQAATALARLQRPLLRALGTGRGAGVQRFEEQDVEGVAVRSVQVSPTVNLSYAVFDRKLVISTDPAGIAQIRADPDSLADSEPFERATDDLPDRVSALVFLNLDELFGQVTRTDLVEDPFFANLSVLFDNATSVAVAVKGEEEEIRSELFLATD